MTQEKKLTDVLTFKNYKNEEYKITRQEFRNAAAGLQHKDHNPQMYDTVMAKATPKERMFELTHINDQHV